MADAGVEDLVSPSRALKQSTIRASRSSGAASSSSTVDPCRRPVTQPHAYASIARNPDFNVVIYRFVPWLGARFVPIQLRRMSDRLVESRVDVAIYRFVALSGLLLTQSRSMSVSSKLPLSSGILVLFSLSPEDLTQRTVEGMVEDARVFEHTAGGVLETPATLPKNGYPKLHCGGFPCCPVSQH